MKRGVWIGILVLLLLVSFIYAEDQTTAEPSSNTVSIVITPIKINGADSAFRATGPKYVDDPIYLNLQEKYNSAVMSKGSATSSPVVIYVTPAEAKFFINNLVPYMGTTKDYFGRPLINYYHKEEGKWKSITAEDIKTKQLTYLMPGSASPGYDYKTVSYPNQGAVCMLS